MSSRFEGKIALVTGGGSGIGEAIAKRLARDGATVIVADITDGRDRVVSEIGGGAVARPLDVTDAASIAALEQWVAAEYGGLDILANNAGVGGPIADMHEYPLEELDKVFAVNARGMFLVLQAGLRLMLESGGGAIVNTASIGGFRATRRVSGYIATKGADVMMTRSAALEYATRGIRVNAVGPGTTDSPALVTSPPEMRAALEAEVPQGRLARPEDIANVVAFLADDAETSHVTGQVWLVDGGRSAG